MVDSVPKDIAAEPDVSLTRDGQSFTSILKEGFVETVDVTAASDDVEDYKRKDITKLSFDSYSAVKIVTPVRQITEVAYQLRAVSSHNINGIRSSIQVASIQTQAQESTSYTQETSRFRLYTDDTGTKLSKSFPNCIPCPPSPALPKFLNQAYDNAGRRYSIPTKDGPENVHVLQPPQSPSLRPNDPDDRLHNPHIRKFV